jgi:hypothetical protein
VDRLAVEWAGGQPGHPTSYALLGGFPSDHGIEIAVEGDGPFTEALAGVADPVVFGLPDGYRNEVVRVLAGHVSEGFTVTVAAHGAAGSSEMAFRFVSGFLAALIEPQDDRALGDLDLWEVWARAARRAIE